MSLPVTLSVYQTNQIKLMKNLLNVADLQNDWFLFVSVLSQSRMRFGCIALDKLLKGVPLSAWETLNIPHYVDLSAWCMRQVASLLLLFDVQSGVRKTRRTDGRKGEEKMPFTKIHNVFRNM